MKHLASSILLALLSTASAAPFIRVARTTQGSWSFELGGRRFYSMGICHIAALETSADGQGKIYDGAKVRRGADAWAKSAIERMTSWGFNTAGAWCDEPIYAKTALQTRFLWLGGELDDIKHPLLHVFSPGYPAKVDALCRQFVAPHKNDPRLIGWFLDNELPWFGDHGWAEDPHRSLLDLALALPAKDANRAEAVRFLREAYGDFASFATQWETSAQAWDALTAGGTARAKTKRVNAIKERWAGHVADRFFTVCAATVRKHDPNHLILGSRFAGNAPGPVFAACAKHCDVVSVNQYIRDGNADLAWWDQLYAITQRPLMMTEFSWRATENRTGNRNTLGADVTVPTQKDRAEHYTRFVSAIMSRPYMVGMHWFQWADEPERGRALDGEDANYGLVDWQDQAYEELTAAAQKTNAAIPSPDKRTGTLPTPADHEGLAWSARKTSTPSLPDGKLAAPVEVTTSTPFISLDAKAATRAAASRDGETWKLDYDSGTGWGFNAVWPSPAQSLAGAKTVRFRYDAPAGAKFHVVMTEKDGDGGDGECWMSDFVPSTGASQSIVLDLAEFELNAYTGNQKGNRRLDLGALRDLGVYFESKQGAGLVRVSSLQLAE